MEGHINLADTKKEAILKANCDQYGVNYIAPLPNETQSEKETRQLRLDKEYRKVQKKNERAHQSSEAEKRERERKKNQSQEAKDRERERKKRERVFQPPEAKDHEGE